MVCRREKGGRSAALSIQQLCITCGSSSSLLFSSLELCNTEVYEPQIQGSGFGVRVKGGGEKLCGTLNPAALHAV
jgi:hypothetical protein